MAKMFEIKAFERKYSNERHTPKIEHNEDDAEVDDIFDDIILPDFAKKKSSTIMEKVDIFDKADPISTQKIIENVTPLGDSQPYVKQTKRFVEGGTFEEDDGTFTTRRKKSAIIGEQLLNPENK
jgi:hypothetical protein